MAPLFLQIMAPCNSLEDVQTRLWYCEGTNTWRWTVTGGDCYDSYSCVEKQEALDALARTLSSITQ